MTRRFYNPQLDMVRFLAFFAVFNHHVLPRSNATVHWLRTFADFCGFGLSLFFVLSAYLITMLLLAEKESTGTVDLGKFYLRRVLRIWPLYLVGLGIGVARAYSHGVLSDNIAWFAGALLLAGNLVPSGGILMSHLWSISVEEQFYLLMPVSGKLGRSGLLLAALLMTMTANFTLISFAHRHEALDSTIWFSSLVQFQMFAAGMALALVQRQLRWRYLSNVAGTLCVMLAGVLAFWVEWTFQLKAQGALAKSAPGLCLGYGCLALACCLFITGMERLPQWPPMVYLGKISFGLYVFHIPAIAVIGTRLHWASLNILASLFLTITLAALSYRFLERPFLLLKRRYEVIAARPV